MAKQRVYVGQVLSLMEAFHLYVISKHVKTNFFVLSCIENFIPSLIVLIVLGPFLVGSGTLKKVMCNYSEYLLSGLASGIKYLAWYFGSGQTSIRIGLAVKGLCYPVSLALMFALVRTIRGGMLKICTFAGIAFFNIIIFVSRDHDQSPDVYCGAFYLLIYVISSVSSNFITTCMVNRNGLGEFLFATSSFHLWVCLFLFIMDFDVDRNEIVAFVMKNPYSVVFLGLSSTVLKILGAFYIQKFGIITYSIAKISCCMYFDIISNVITKSVYDIFRLCKVILPLIWYLERLVVLDYEEVSERALGFMT